MQEMVGGPALARLLDGWQQSPPGRPGERGAGTSPQRLAGAVSALVLDGRLPTRCRMPSERDLAAGLHVSRATVAAAYARLRDTGFLASRQGSGSWTRLPSRSRARIGPLTPGSPVDGDPAGDDLVDLAISAPAAPPDLVTEAFGAAAADLPRELERAGAVGRHGYHPAGLPRLREVIAARYTTRGVATDPDQILVTAGAQGAIDLLVRHLLDPRDVALIEQPTYPNAIDALRRTRARMVPVAVTPQGWDVERLTETLAQVGPRLAYLLPDFHNPTGALLPEPDRGTVVAAARRAGTTVIVDETHAELPLDGQPMPPPMAAYDRDGRVITVGSLSKTYWGGLRVGWIRATARMVSDLALARSAVDLGGPVVEHLAAVHLIEEADRALPIRRAEFAAGRDVLSALIAEHLPGWQASGPTGGLSLWLRLDAPMSTALSEAAERHGVRLAAGPRFGIDGALEQYLRIPYVAPEAELSRAVQRVAAARDDVRQVPPTSLRTAPVVA